MDLIETADMLFFLASIVGYALGVVGFFKSRRALAEIAALRARLAAPAPVVRPAAASPVPPDPSPGPTPVRGAVPEPPAPLVARGEGPAGPART